MPKFKLSLIMLLQRMMYAVWWICWQLTSPTRKWEHPKKDFSRLTQKFKIMRKKLIACLEYNDQATQESDRIKIRFHCGDYRYLW